MKTKEKVNLDGHFWTCCSNCFSRSRSPRQRQNSPLVLLVHRQVIGELGGVWCTWTTIFSTLDGVTKWLETTEISPNFNPLRFPIVPPRSISKLYKGTSKDISERPQSSSLHETKICTCFVVTRQSRVGMGWDTDHEHLAGAFKIILRWSFFVFAHFLELLNRLFNDGKL